MVNTSAVAAWLQPQEILLDVDARDQLHALEIVAAAIGCAHGLDSAPIYRALSRREWAGSTAMGNGFAIPHARIAGIARPLTLFMRTARAVRFPAPDGELVSEMLAIMVPADGAKEDHLELLALVARLFSGEAFRRQLERAPDAPAAAEIFRIAVAQVVAEP